MARQIGRRALAGSRTRIRDRRAVSSSMEILDSFEEGISAYSGDTSAFGTSDALRHGRGSLLATSTTADTDEIISRADVTVSQGDTFKSWVWRESSTAEFSILYFVQAAAGASSVSGYEFYVGTDRVLIARFDSGSWTELNTTTGLTVPSGELLQHDVSVDGSGNFTFQLLDESDSSIGSVLATDTNYTSGGMGANAYNGDTVVDFVRKGV